MVGRKTPMRAVVAIALLALAAALSPAHGAAEGCIAVGTHSIGPANSRPWDCFYTATGPGYFTAQTSNPFVIAVSRDRGASWTELFRRSKPGVPVAGTLKTVAGELVSVSISCWDYWNGVPCSDGSPASGRTGVIVAHSRI